MKRARPVFALRATAGKSADARLPAEARAAKSVRLKSLGELKSVRVARAPVETPVRAAQPTVPLRKQPDVEAATEFREAVRDVTPLRGTDSRIHRAPAASPAWPHPVQRERDNRAVLDESLADQIGIESLLDTDESLSYRRNGISADTLRKLRRGFWVVQAELDLHGHRVAEAHLALGAFLREAVQNGQRCVRIVHGKGHGSRDRVPVLKGKVRAWLARRSDVIAFCQARPADGGAGALLVLLRPTTSA
jgi:DNA-nicking Smr family endonuclease